MGCPLYRYGACVAINDHRVIAATESECQMKSEAVICRSNERRIWSSLSGYKLDVILVVITFIIPCPIGLKSPALLSWAFFMH